MKKKQEQLEQIEQAVKEQVDRFVEDPELFYEYVRFKQNFRHYSANNTLLIFSQNPNAYFVASYKKWAELGYQVKKGAKALRIYAPFKKVFYLSEDKSWKRLDKRNKKLVQRIKKENIPTRSSTGYKLVPVFADNQTNITSEDLPKILTEGHLIQSDVDVSLFQKAQEIYLKEKKIPLVKSDFSDLTTGGFYDQHKKGIVLAKDLSDFSTFRVTAHEMAHAILHDKDHGLFKELNDKRNGISFKEAQAEFVASVIIHYYTGETHRSSLRYIKIAMAGISDDKEKRECLNMLSEPIFKIIDDLDYIIMKLLKEKEEKSA